MVMEAEKKMNQLQAEHVYVNGHQLSREELSLLQGCANPPPKLKPGCYWYDKDSGLWGKMGSLLLSSSLQTFPKRFRFGQGSTPNLPLVRQFFPSNNSSSPFPSKSITLTTKNCKGLLCNSSMAEESVEKLKPGVQIYESEEDLSVSLAKYTADLSQKFVKERGAFTVVLSGGSLIKSLRKMVESPYLDSVDWGQWHVFWVDERVVRKDHIDSNYNLAYDGFLSKVREWEEEILSVIRDFERWGKLSVLMSSCLPECTLQCVITSITSQRKWAPQVRRSPAFGGRGEWKEGDRWGLCVGGRVVATTMGMFALFLPFLFSFSALEGVPVPPGHVYAMNDALPAEGAADDYETRLKQLVKTKVLDFKPASEFPRFDLILLGMGPDGHVASLFPGHNLLNENQRWVTFVKDSPKPPPERITFTFPVINSASNIAVVAAGAGKSDVVRRALGSKTTSDLLPVEMVSPEDGEATWFLDKHAASKL
ncbi:hypothetical protein IFM89_002820 [Coptis chinensis]|uniref:Glucosamine/galactosamine-6-phosphate isomerase domain-containing protein n=1 Tax=Coptis chinensis TaxID=261450 RepID=A0A835HNJ6_9MAGN|nr:hypothetical protein IFM89_002820 [Coptis chinensis]